MKKVKGQRVICILLTLFLLADYSLAFAGWADFTDITGHWSESAVREAYYNGLITGYEDHTIRPDRAITKAEVLAFLTRSMSATATVNMSGMGIDPGQWYYKAVSQALALGIIQSDELGDMNVAMRREDVFVLISRAFQLVKPDQTLSASDRFPDAGQISYRARASIAALVERGYIQGTGNGLSPKSNSTRAEIVTVLGRIIGSYMLPEELTSETTGGASIPVVVLPPEGGAEIGQDDGRISSRSPIVTLSELTLYTDVLINSFASDITLTNVVTGQRILVRSARLDNLSMDGGQISQLTLAAVSGNVAFAPEAGGSVNTFTVGTGGGIVRLNGDISNVEITGSGRTVYLDMPSLDSLKISGTGNTVYISDATQVRDTHITGTASNTTLVIDGSIDTLTMSGDRSSVRGSGYISSVYVTGLDCSLDIQYGSYDKNLDYGLEGVDIVLTPSTNTVPAGGNLKITASFTGVRGAATVCAQWYRDGTAVPGYGNSAFPLTADKTSAFSPGITFAENMKTNITIGFELTYIRYGVLQRQYREITVKIENYPYEYYHPGPTADDKLIALTFDDGPGRYTNRLLDELAARDIHATFFVLGSCAEQYPNVIRRMASDGHEIASHTYSHPNLTGLSASSIRSELDRTASTLKSIAGVSPTCLRPPYGSYNQSVRNICAEKGLPIIYWSVDTEDWKSRNVNTILKRMFNNGSQSVKDGDIILMHDIYSTTVEAAISAIDRLLADGYTFVTVSELLDLRCGGGVPGQVYVHGRR